MIVKMFRHRHIIPQLSEQAEFKVNKKIEGVELLIVSEYQVRLTGMQIGDVKL